MLMVESRKEYNWFHVCNLQDYRLPATKTMTPLVLEWQRRTKKVTRRHIWLAVTWEKSYL
jgi:hypothetical protein